MIGISAWDYIFIRTCIFVLHLVAPLSVLYSLVSWLLHLPFRIPRVLEVWLALEAVFYLLVYLPRRTYLQAVVAHPAGGRDERRRLFWRCHINIPDPERYLKRWFRDAPTAEIKRENVKDFFRWAFLHSGEPDPAYDEELEEYVGEMEKLLGRKLEPGRGNAQSLRLTLDKVEMLHRSLTWYLCVFVVDTLASIYLRYYSFSFYRTSLFRFLAVFPTRLLTLLTTYRSPARTLTYWYRPHTSRTRLPVLFIHGIGVGLYPYIPFLADLNATNGEDLSDGQVGIIAIEILPISSRITAEALLKDEMCEEVHCILKAHGWESYGSVVATHLLHTPRIAGKIGPILFVDPVSFLLHLPDVAYNFLWRKPTLPSEHLLSYFGSKDMGVAHTLFRRFIWSDNALWKEDVQGHHVAVVLAGKDVIVDTKVIGAYLTGADYWPPDTGSWENGIWKGDGLDVLWFQELDHGEAFSRRRTRKRLVDIVRRFVVES
ncbi:hypothetical protein MRS44_013203 [Fusarium solani]|uniref:uncharacterized protein n=1 Tax=Fusarium solani TaxID=169388 RepID=UPI0032C49D6D|nr:hypothetical protein MRS44_018886 [Fusarium solani]KAJ3453380.1 hypothetical protein MRS44_017627 [Fusarium solani]KAJ3454603.1 hypothetical protein MRS44_013203 [Fusarium solani]